MNAAEAPQKQALKQLLRTRTEVARYIDRVRHLYPYGVAKVETPEVAAAPRLVFVIYGEGNPIAENLDLLLTSIITRGLELERSGVDIVYGSSRDEEELRRILLKEYSPSENIVIVMGSPLFPSGTWMKEGASEILHTRGLGDIAMDTGVKREFWGHLKSVLARLATHRPS